MWTSSLKRNICPLNSATTSCCAIPSVQLRPSPAQSLRNGQKKKMEKSEHNKSLKHWLRFVFLVMSSSTFLRPYAKYSRNSTTLQKSCSQLCAAWLPLPHTYTQHKYAHPTLKGTSNTPFFTPFPSHASHLHPTKYSTNRTTTIQSSTPPNTL